MAFRNQMDNSSSNMNAGMGQRFLPDQLSWNSQYGLGRKTTGGELSPGSRKNMGVGMPPQPQQQPPGQQAPSQQKPRKTGLFGEDEDNETSLYFSQTSVFRADREMMSNSPSGGLTSSSQLAAGLMANTQLAGLMANAPFSGNSQLTGSLGLTGNSQSSGLGSNSQLSSGLSVSSQLNQLTSGLTGNLQLSGNSQVPGSSQSSASFGTSQNSVGFGTSQNSGGFGSGQNSSGFGSSQSTGGFGSTQNSIGFGTSQSSGGFGSTQNSSGFGSSQSTASSFGTSQAASGFGTSQTGSGFGTSQTGSASFGSTPPSSGFGNSSTSSGFGSSQLSGGLPGTSQSSSTFGNNFYTPGLGNLANFQQRGGITGPQFRGNNATPTSMNPNFPLNLQAPQQPSPNRNIMSAIGGQRINQNLQNLQKRSVGSGMPASNPPLNSMNNSYMFGQSSRQIFGNDDSQPSLDLSEFPTLGNRSSLQSSNPVPSNRNYVGMVSKPASESTPEFQIQQEDFPALPGAQNPPTSSSTESARKTPTSTAQGIFDQALTKDGKFPGDKTGQSKRGIQTHPDGTVSNIPSGMVTDQFGIVGLLTFIRAAENDPNLVALAPGIDLTTLGLNLNSPENLYSTFQSPWVDLPCRPQDIDFHVPAEYLTNIFIRDKLAPIKLNRYGEDLLFFLFYMNGGDVLQLAAAAELYSRDWRYHKDERVWITRAPGVEPIVKTNTYERGTYYFFDAQNWRKVAKEFHLEYDKLEERPTLPPTIHHNANQPIIAH